MAAAASLAAWRLQRGGSVASLAAAPWREAWQLAAALPTNCRYWWRRRAARRQHDAVGHGRGSSCHHCAAAARSRGGNENTSDDSNGGGKFNKEARQLAWQQWRQLGYSAVLVAVAAQQRRRHHQLGSGSVAAMVASLAEEVAAWRKCDFGGSGSTLGSTAAVRRRR